MTAFKAAINLCGLTQLDAANLLNVSLPTIKVYSTGLANPTRVIWSQLARQFQHISSAADSAAEKIIFNEMDKELFNSMRVTDGEKSFLGDGDYSATALAIFQKVPCDLK